MPEIALEQKFIDIVAEQLGVDKRRVTPNQSAKGDLGADSLDLVELIMALEEGYEIKIDDGEPDNLENLGELQALILSKVAAK
ncbi:MAG: acyl carrier protein [Candidatus Nomurabacteria bacterium]|nr:MAG: acyl carrier protein [Candidatus Nomurabacteria bacterium]